jgi:hypothetical protein
MIQKIRNSRFAKGFALYLAFTLISEIIQPSVALALTGGPSQPEVESFTPIGTTEMVDLSSGNFNYNIPLLDVGGYPINIAYNSGVTMDQEASWVGLGWNINPGVINRNLRGLPDDFNGDVVEEEFNMRPNFTAGISLNTDLEIFGYEPGSTFGMGLSFGRGVNWNNYNGFFITKSLGPSLKFGETNKFGFGLGLSSSTNDGVSVNPSVSYSRNTSKTTKSEIAGLEVTTFSTSSVGGSLGAAWSSRQGLRDLSVNLSRIKSSTINLGLVAGNYRRTISSKTTSRSIGSSISFAASTYTPSIAFPMNNISMSFTGKLGPKFYGLQKSKSISGYFSNQWLKDKERSSPAYGYMHMRKWQDDSKNSISDFNREKSSTYIQGTSNIGFGYLTNDMFSVVGQGVGGQFRPYHSSIGYNHDPRFVSNGGGGKGGLEFGTGNLAESGFSVVLNYSHSVSGNWNDSKNLAIKKLGYEPINSITDDKEGIYFKNFGDLSVDNESERFDSLGGFRPIRVLLKDKGLSTTTKYVASNSSSYSIKNFQRNERVKRNQAIGYLDNTEVSLGGLNDYVSSNAEPHHFGEFSITKSDGARYVYGIPAYNTVQKEASFNVGKATDNGDGLVEYEANMDNSTNNKKGRSRFYQKTITPAYAHSFLLSAVLSADYQDLDEVRGPSISDLGTYVKFDYGGQPAINNYKWRVPYEEGKANFNQGFRSLDSDNKGSYIYGEKEIWYIEKIETKTHVAIFHLSDRKDGYEVKGENGGLDANCRPMKKLDKITLYAKPDYDENGLNAVPIKTVHFEYNYELCGNVPNNDGTQEIVNGQNINDMKGKLTLKKVYFSYGNSNRGKLSAYNFNYETSNPDYDLKKYNMWGTFKEYGSQAANNTEFPYVNQYENRTTHDSYASAWSLSRISLPSGGEINIEYESDDYAYVQDRHATQLLEIVNATKVSNLSAVVSPESTIELFDQNDDPNLYLWFRLIGDDASGILPEEFKTKYLDKLHDNGGKLYFYCLSDFSSGNEEFVSGYAEVEDNDYYGVDNVGGEYYGYVKLKSVDRENKRNSTTEQSHPIAKAAWQFVRLHLPQLLSTAGKNIDDDMDYTTILQAMATWPLPELFKGPNQIVKDKDIGNGIVSGKSWARLASPNGKKVGGGVRVKSVQIADSWDVMTTSGEERFYGQEYFYELDEDGESSGVATFEPLISKENPFVEPVYFDVRKWMIPDDQHMLEKPYGASFFPAPQITYSRVVSRALYPEYNEGGTDYVVAKNRRTGHTETNFYTSRDFPTKVSQTDLDTKPKIGNSKILQLLKVVVNERHIVSQGYMVETNDMNGKIKSTFVYDEGGNIISGNEYKYFSNGDRLANNVLTLNKDGSIENKDIGIEFDVFNDFNKFTSLNVSGGVNANFGTFLAGVLPVPYIAPFPVATFERTVLRSSATFKTVNRVGILKEVIAYQDGASVSTENMAWDAETGEVLLTRTKNQFDDLVYNYSFPAHWAYDRMGQAYKNLGLNISNFEYQQPGVFEAEQSGQVDDYVAGDEVLLTSFISQSSLFFELNPSLFSPTKKAWVLDVNPTTNRLTLIDKNGELLDNTGLDTYISIKVIKSGRKNQQSLSIGSMLMKKNPIDETIMEITNARLSSLENDIIDAGVAEYSDQWSVQRGVVGECVSTATNTGNALITFLNALIDNNHIGNGSVFSSANVSSFPNFIDLFDAFQLCGSHFQSCTNLEAINVWSTDSTKLSVHFNCIGQPDCAGQEGCQIPLIDNSGMLDGSINFTNVESFELNPNANGLQGLVIGKWANNIEVVFDLYSDCLDFDAFTDCTPVRDCGFEAGAKINPFVNNLRGNFRSLRTWVKLGDRKQMTGSGQNVDQRTQGAYEDFVFFWQNPGNGNDWEATPDSDNNGSDDWTWVNSVTNNAGYNENGIQQENKDALYRYSSAIFGYQDKLPIAVAANATKSQIGFDGFEDYGFYDYQGCPERHFAFDSYKHLLTDETSHTGTYSIALNSSSEISMARELAAKPCDLVNYGFPTSENPYLLSECEMYNLFGPETFDRAAYERSVHLGTTPHVEVAKDQKYVISYWVKKDNPSLGDDNFSGVVPVVTADQLTITLTNQRLSPVIDGWQKIDYTFEISGIDPAVATEHPISIGFKNNTTNLVFIDDVRIQPFNSEMSTYVYDPSNFRLVAELDGNNFATFYEYNNEGKLLRIKKETERGIKTIQENREHKVSTNN